ncbi:MAG: uracil-DNA glycosylase [Herminiimonas sp.]|nr:uracil-DNA glycosylase [Herminiimonas sp.]
MTRRDQLIEALGIGPQWVRRGLAAPAAAPPTDAEIAAMDWPSLQIAVRTCTRCALCQTRTSTVFGTGDPHPVWLIVGEGPGSNEDREGEPFLGPAGKLLDNMLASISLRRDKNVFITNVVKCRPTDADGRDRAPSSEEITACRPYLERQITLLKPNLALALGKTAALTLLQRPSSTTLAVLRGEVHHVGTLPMVVTYHPAYLLRVLTDKRKTWEDLCLAVDVLDNRVAAALPSASA